MFFDLFIVSSKTLRPLAANRDLISQDITGKRQARGNSKNKMTTKNKNNG